MAEPEPTAWELMRAIQALNDNLEKLASNMMTAAMFEIHQKGTDRRFETMEKQIQAEKEARVKEINDIQVRLTNDANYRRQITTGLLISVALAVFGVILNFISAGPPT